jgi:hypothetical protein
VGRRPSADSSLITELAVVYYAAVRFIMNILRTGVRPDSDGVINEPGSACFQETLLLLKDLRRLQSNHPRNLINDCQSLIKRSVKIIATIATFVVFLVLVGCSGKRADSLLGTWQTDLIPSEWGTNRITVTYFEDGRIAGTNDFPGEGALAWQGTYRVRDSVIERTIDGRTDEIVYRLEGDTMHQTFGVEGYTFRRNITEPDGAGNSHRAGQ